MDKAQERYYRSLHRLNDSDFLPVLEHLKNLLSTSYVTLAKASTKVEVFRTQGRISVLEDFLEDIAASRENLS